MSDKEKLAAQADETAEHPIEINIDPAKKIVQTAELNILRSVAAIHELDREFTQTMPQLPLSEPSTPDAPAARSSSESK